MSKERDYRILPKLFSVQPGGAASGVWADDSSGMGY